MATEVRQQFASVIQRYMAGDASLVPEIVANAQSAEPLAQLARETLPDPVSPAVELESPESLAFKRKREELELTRQALEIDRLALENKRMAVDMQTAQINNVQRMIGVVEFAENSHNWEEVRKARGVAFALLEDMVAPVAGGSGRALTSGSALAVEDGPKQLRISTVVAQLGYGYIAGDHLTKIGIKLKELYIQKHGSDPRKEMQNFPGGYGQVNVYYEGDRELIVEAVKSVLEPGSF